MGLGSDGASVIKGWHTGVGAQFKSVVPFLIHTHCVAHRLYVVHRLLNQLSYLMSTKY